MSSSSPPPAPPQIPPYMKFILGGSSGMGACFFVQPFDLIKTRMQVGANMPEYATPVSTVKTVVHQDGILGLYNGLSAGLLRQATYTTTRLGVYTQMNDWYRSTYERAPKVLDSILMSIIAGGMGAFVGNPAEVGLIRMMADGRLPPDQKRNYTSVFNALNRVYKEEGIRGWFTGATPTVIRAMVVNITQLTSYTQFKMYFRDQMGFGDGVKTHICASMMAGLLTAFTSLPVDNAKTRIQNMKGLEYSGMGDAMLKVCQNEGVLKLWKGFTPYYCRIGPNVVLTFLLLETLTKLYNKHVLGLADKGSSI